MLGDEAGQGGPAKAIRLTLVQDGNDLKVISRQSVRMRVPASDPTYGFESKSGFWLEVRSAEHDVVYRRSIPDPLDEEIEAPSGDPERPFTRARAPDERVFVLLVPDTDDGRELVLCASPRGVRAGKARPFATIDLKSPNAPVRILARRNEPPQSPPKTRARKPGTRKKKRRK